MKTLSWHKVLNAKTDLAENRIITVNAGNKQVALSHFEGKICALDNHCPHQGGPLGEGSIENGILRCPWHGWDYHPCTGKAPGFDDGVDAYPVEEREDGIYVGIEIEKPHQTTISDVMAETMVNWGVDTVFGMVGHSNLGFADALKRLEKKERLKFIAIRHEGAGAFAASAYGKLTGKPAVCFSIAGPGATNMFTGLWDAKVDRAPILALTGQVATQVVGTGNFQEVDLVRAFQTVADFNHRVQKDSQHAELMSLAIKHAIINRDVSHLTFPDEIQEIPVDDKIAQTPEGRMGEMQIIPATKSIADAVQLIKKSKRPVIVVGHGAKFNMPQIIAFAEQLNTPVLTTFKGKGLIPDKHRLAAGVLGRSGTPVASWFMNECDLLIVLGASFSNHTGITPKKPTIQVDFDPLVLGKFHKIDVPVWGELSTTVGLFSNALKGEINTIDQRKELVDRWGIWRSEKRKRLLEDNGRGVSSIAVFDQLSKLISEDAVVCVDVGNNAYSLGRYFESKNQDFLMSGYLGSIGFALPAALGAWAATRGKRQIVAVAGDGGFAQYMAELCTSVKYGMNIKIILLNNSELGKITKEQRSGGFEKFATDLHNPDFAEFANGCGALGLKAKGREELESKMKVVLDYEGTALLEIITDGQLI
ncbi:MAG: pyruvate oxidase [Bacteroidetes bacterium HGW-Bacteroidetes-1]|jgi:thiamine pyrophosphate-dependent acetolactate synthase large subunit-like protein/nitrite reductase/ring-hydroxylating ferredoxin subunit|nr:MAG: pyruvate oxidase [Bacteroidetes bacterium HGW-Bacteroidetes-1]